MKTLSRSTMRVASRCSRCPTSSANTRASSITFSPATRTSRRRALSTPRFSAASTGIPACTRTGCWCACSSSSRPARGRGDPQGARRAHCAGTDRGELAYLARPKRAASSALRLGMAAEARPDEFAPWDHDDARRWSAHLRAAFTQPFARRYRLAARSPLIRSAMACTATARSVSPSRSTTRAQARHAIVRRALHHRARVVSSPIATRRGRGSPRRRLPLARADRGGSACDGYCRRTNSRLAGAFLPRIDRREPAALFTPAVVSDRSDPQIVHLDGLNLSRAWCWRGIAHALPAGDPRAGVVAIAAARASRAGLSGVARGDYAGDHWLATFAVLALTIVDFATWKPAWRIRDRLVGLAALVALALLVALLPRCIAQTRRSGRTSRYSWRRKAT